MPDQISSFKVICSGGLNSNENHLDLSDNYPGAASRMLNYEPSLFGGYRRIEGYSEFDSDYGIVTVDGSTTGDGKVLGIAIFKDDVTGGTTIIAARKDAGAATYSFYFYTANVGWRKYTLNHSASRAMTANGATVDRLRHVQFNFGTGNKIVFVDGVNEAIIFDGSHWCEIKSSNSGGYTAGTSHDNGNGTAGGAKALNAPALVDVFENHLFLSGHEAARAAIAHSAPNDPYTWTAAAGAGQIAAGFDVVQIKPFRDNLFVFGSKNIKKITVNASNAFALENVTTNIGCVARDSVLEVGGDLMFLSPDGFRPVAGTSRVGDIELETLSKPIQSTLVDLIKNEDMNALTGVVVRSKSQVRYFVTTTVGSTVQGASESTGIIGGLTNSGSGIGWEFGELLGIRASCCTSDYVGSEELILHGDHDGRVFKQDSGISFNGANIISVYSTPYLDFGETEQRKELRKINTFVRAEGPFELNLAVDYDWGDYNTSVPSTYSQASSGAPTTYAGRGVTYNGDNIVYGGASKPVMTSDIQGSGFSVRATFVTDGQTEPFSIQGLVFEFSAAGRR
jgi:hypothetical protein|tara:strand:- start:118 stop:1812 length:1695 start_codon:yes stop_codon:yes gene_type:complete